MGSTPFFHQRIFSKASNTPVNPRRASSFESSRCVAGSGGSEKAACDGKNAGEFLHFSLRGQFILGFYDNSEEPGVS
ncbi:MAG: hypothetical protein EBS01_04300 [Verrucomicrobia bacterium]|nr:hypothetical protein [Verrucomicrobiota bacterium]